MSKTRLSIVIVNFRSEKCLLGCIASVYDKIFPRIPSEVIVVNNDAQEKLEGVKKNFPGVVIIDRGKNEGFGASNNIGANIAQGETLWFLNPDTIVLSAEIEEVLKEFEKDEKVAVIGVRPIDDAGRTQEWIAGYDKNLWDLVRNNLNMAKSRKVWQSKEAIGADWVAGTAMFFRKSAFQELGGFDKEFFMYFEDVDICRRARNAGWKVLYSPRFAVKHYGGQSYAGENEKGARRQKKNYYESQEYYFQKHGRMMETAAIKLIRKLFLN